MVDPLFGAPLVASLRATRDNARILQLGMSAGSSATIPWIDLLGRSILGYKNTTAPDAVKRTAYQRMMRHSAHGEFWIDSVEFPLAEIESAWGSLGNTPHRKILIVPGDDACT